MKKDFIWSYLLIIIIGFGCVETDIHSDIDGIDDLNTVQLPEEFDFATSDLVTINIQDLPGVEQVKYSVYSFGADTLNDLVVSGFVDQSASLTLSANLPDYVSEVYIIRNEGGQFDGFEIPVLDREVNFTYVQPEGRFGSQLRTADGCTEVLYGVNAQGDFFTIDNESGNYEETILPDLTGGGSIACAVNRVGRIVYYNTGNTLRYYDIEAGTFHVANEGNPFNGNYPRMEYNNSDGLLYIAKNENMYILDPKTNVIVSSIGIAGIESPVSGGDVAISLDGTIYMCAFSGLYRIEIAGDGSSAQATRISAEGLPFQPTSMAIDRDDRLYLATNDANSQLIEMDKFDGAWQVVQTYDHSINDLGSLPCSLDELDQTDTDGDGVNDPLDEFPNDSEKATTSYTPSKYGWGTLAFEDLWPSKGDFDFNDLVVNYRFVAIANGQNDVVALEANFNVRAIGASQPNGFGIELPISPDLISNVEGFHLNENIVSVDGKGLEVGQSKAVIIVFDNAFKELPHVEGLFVNTELDAAHSVADDIQILIEFVNPISQDELGKAPFNPFIFINGDRGRELHLKDHLPTDLVNTNYFQTAADATDAENNAYYKTSNNLPFAIDIIHELRYPVEQAAINVGYNHFINWAISEGSQYSDWYKDNSGYRNTQYLYLK